MLGDIHPPKRETFDLTTHTNTDPKGIDRAVDVYAVQPWGLYMARPTPGRAQFHYLESWLLPALDLQLDHILSEGADVRYQRHLAMAELVRDWAAQKYELFAEEGYRSVTVTCIANTRGTDIGALNQQLVEKHGAVLANGYGPLKDKTFRIGHMGDLTPTEISELLGWLDPLV